DSCRKIEARGPPEARPETGHLAFGVLSGAVSVGGGDRACCCPSASRHSRGVRRDRRGRQDDAGAPVGGAPSQRGPLRSRDQGTYAGIPWPAPSGVGCGGEAPQGGGEAPQG